MCSHSTVQVPAACMPGANRTGIEHLDVDSMTRSELDFMAQDRRANSHTCTNENIRGMMFSRGNSQNSHSRCTCH